MSDVAAVPGVGAVGSAELAELTVDQALILLSERHAEVYNAIRLAIQEAVGRAWDALGNVDDAARDAFVAAVTPVVEAGQAQVAAATHAMVTQSLTVAGEAALADAVAVADLGALRGGVPTSAVYERPVVTMRDALSKGKEWAVAKARARARAVSSASMDMALAQRHAMADAATKASAAAGGERVVGYRRVLSGASCRFCATASTQRYYPNMMTGGDPGLMPLHNHCDCGVAPIIGDRDPGQIINREVLGRLKERGPQYWKEAGYVDNDGNPISPEKALKGKVDTAVHGELGPVFGAEVGPELELAERIAADRDRAREILENHKGTPPPHPGPYPQGKIKLPPQYDAPDADWEEYRRWKAEYDEWAPKDIAYKKWLRGETSVLRDEAGNLTDEGRELLARTKAVGAQVRAEALAKNPHIGGLISERDARRLEWEGAKSAKTAASADLKAVEIDVHNAIAMELHGTPYQSLPYKDKGAVQLARMDDDRWKEANAAKLRADLAAAEAEKVYNTAAKAAHLAERDAIFAELQRLRPAGSGSALNFAVKAKSGESLAVSTAIRDAAEWYPKDWVDAIGADWVIEHGKVERGFCQTLEGPKKLRIMLSKDGTTGQLADHLGAYGRVAVHELGHAVESATRHTKTLEWAFLQERKIGSAVTKMDGLTTYPDDFPTAYFGKVYPGGMQGSYELLSMSMDTFVGGRSNYPPMDDDHLAWLLGSWVVG